MRQAGHTSYRDLEHFCSKLYEVAQLTRFQALLLEAYTHCTTSKQITKTKKKQKQKQKQKQKNTTICQRGSGLLLGSRVIPLANPSGKAAPFRSIPERLTGESWWTAWARCEGVLPRGAGLGWCWASRSCRLGFRVASGRSGCA